jgi:hypothetical protein
LKAVLKDIISRYSAVPAINNETWASKSYRPTPTIIEAAEALFSGHFVKEITKSEAGAINLEKTAFAVLRAVNDAKKESEKVFDLSNRCTWIRKNISWVGNCKCLEAGKPSR